jgi:hypothetical protein
MVGMYDLKLGGTSQEVISHIRSFTRYFTNRIKRIFWDNASNLNSLELDNWATVRDIIIENSTTYHPAGNLFAKTNIKRCKRAVGNLFRNNRCLTCASNEVQDKIAELNLLPVNGSTLAPCEILFHLRSTAAEFGISHNQAELDADFNDAHLLELAARYGTGAKILENKCNGLKLDHESFYLQNRKQPTHDPTEAHNHKALNMGDIWF